MGRIRIAAHDFLLRVDESLALPEYKGSTLRGGFGHAFRKVTCALRQKDCSSCIIREKCIYIYVFETQPPVDATHLRKIRSIPHPFVLEPPLDTKRFYRPGEHISFRLVLLGKAIDYLPYFIYTFEELGRMGIGRGKAGFSLEEVRIAGADCGSRRIYSGLEKVLHVNEDCVDEKAVSASGRSIAGEGEIVLRFLTPTRLIFEERLVTRPEFHHVARNLLRRLYNLLQFHCGLTEEWDFKGLIEKAQAVRTVSSKIYWYDWERYSSRQDTRMKLGGFMGEVTYAGDFTPFAWHLALGEYLHLGKGATFGLGKYEVRGKGDA